MKTRILTVALLLTLSLRLRAAGPPVLAWNPNAEPDIASYVLHIGTNAGSYQVDVTIAAPLTNISSKLLPWFAGRTNYVTVTAVSTVGFESGFSNEITANIPANPKSLRLTLESAPTPTGPWAETGDALLAQVDTSTTRFYRARLIAGDN